MVKIPLSPDYEIIRWQLKYLTERAGELTDKQRDLLISFESQFLRKGTLSPLQMEILEDIYNRY